MLPRARAVGASGAAGALLTILMASFPTVALAQESATEAAAPDATAMIVFLIVFVGMIAAYILWTVHQHKKQKKKDLKEGGIN